jgi:tetratricopeptide (TPR) repeat protein
MRLEFTRTWQCVLFLATAVILSGTVIVFSAKAYIAARWDASSNPALCLKAAKLEPGNAEYWRHAGLLRQWDLNPSDMRDAMHYLQIASQVNSRSSGIWMDLADAYATAGDAERAKEAYDRAQTSFPMSSEVAWRYGNFLLYQENYSGAYPKIRKAISIDPSLTQSALTECWQSNPDVAPIVRDLLPDKREYYVSAVEFFLARKLADPALAVWNRQKEGGLAVDMEETVPLVEALISEDRIGEAQQVWRSGLQASKWVQDSEGGRSLVLNGGFEHDIANGGFDWREVPLSAVNFEFDSAFAHSGTRSLRIEFDGTDNVDFGHLFQYVPVASDVRYHFSAFVRTEGLTTDRGISFEIVDAHHSEQLQVATCELTGTNAWTMLQTDFVSGPETQAVKITLRRLPSWKFDNKFSGTIWVDDVTLTPAPAQVTWSQ